MGFLIFLGLCVVLVALTYRYLGPGARARQSADQSDDLLRADDNQPPPYDGSAGMWPIT